MAAMMSCGTSLIREISEIVSEPAFTVNRIKIGCSKELIVNKKIEKLRSLSKKMRV